MNVITVKDKQFVPSISAQQIQKAVKDVAQQINSDFAGKEIFFVGVLNGVFMFASDIMKYITVPCKISFVKVSSYQGTQSTGQLKKLIGLNESIEGKNVIILEDIVDTGFSMKCITEQLKKENPADLRICTLLFKPESFKENFKIDYTALSIPNAFIVGYGLDYEGYGRNYPEIYVIKE